MKNYFIMKGYLLHDSPKGLLHYNQMNYPFGEYIYYTDNTPLFSLFIKLFSRYIFDITPFVFYLFHLLVAVNILLTARLTWLITKRFIKNNWLHFFLTLSIPWCNIQITRIEPTANLSFSCLIAVAIYLLILLYERRHDRLTRLVSIWLWLFVLCSLSFFIHGYYILLIGIPVFAFHFFWFLSEIYLKKRMVKIIGAIVPLLAIGFSYLIVIVTDPWINLRAKKANGYDWIEWKTQFLGLFSAHNYQLIKFPVASYDWINYESHAYLGAFTLYGCLLIIIFLFWKAGLRAYLIKSFSKQEGSKLLVLLLLAGLFSLIISFGNEYRWNNTGVEFINVLNPLYWLFDYFPMITQFRALGRFSWFFYYPTIIAVAFLLEQCMVEWRESKILEGLFLLLLFFLIRDTYDYVRHLNRSVVASNPLNEEVVNKIPTSTIRFNDYQAILPIPYYDVGSEDYNYTIDPNESWCTFTFQLSQKTGLPLMSAKLGRSAVYQNHAFINSFLNYKIDSVIATALNPKLILVALGKQFLYGAKEASPPQLEPALTAYKNMNNFMDSLKMKKLFETDEVAYYEWDWKK